MGVSPLHYAAADAKEAEVATLLAAGADPNLQDDNGWSPLHFAAQAASAKCSELLLEAGTNVQLHDSYGNSALFREVFCSSGDGEIIQLLRAASADPHATHDHGVSPFVLAHTVTNYDIAQYFSDVAVSEFER